MAERANSFRLTSSWRVEAAIQEVATILGDVDRLPDWWGGVYLAVEIVDQGDGDGVGRVVDFHSRGWLPYTLRWRAHVTAAEPPHRWTIAATGDLVGTGQWTLTQDGPVAVVRYDWEVLAEKPILRLLSPVLKPVFAWNHRWAMACGLEGLQAELARRRLG